MTSRIRPQQHGPAGEAEVLLGEVPSAAGAVRPRIIGYLEKVALPRWGLARMTAKMDTGADTSALHVEGLEPRGATRVTFTVIGDPAAGSTRHRVQARIERRGWVRASNGLEEERIFVRTLVHLAGRSCSIELSLVDRSRMQQRMLLGRAALGGVYLVDPARAYLASGEEP